MKNRQTDSTKSIVAKFGIFVFLLLVFISPLVICSIWSNTLPIILYMIIGFALPTFLVGLTVFGHLETIIFDHFFNKESGYEGILEENEINISSNASYK